MIHAVDQIADVVQIPGNLRQLDGVRVVAQRFKNIARCLGHMRHMGKAMLGVAQSDQRLIRFADIGTDGLIGCNFLKGHKLPPFLLGSTKSIPQFCAECKTAAL